MIKISVVMPIHDTQIDILKEAIADVLAQTYSDFQLILVDDCSKDKSIISELCRIKDNNQERIKLITLKEVSGAAHARNVGLEISLGEYIIFLDSDDRFEKSMLEKMYDSIKMKDADVCICNYSYFDREGKKGRFDEFVLDKTDEEWLSKVPMNPWTRLVKREYLIRNNIKFQSLSSCNDVYYAVMTMLLTDRIAVLGNEYLINYRIGRPGAISNNRDSMNLWKAFESINEKIVELKIEANNARNVDAALIKAAICEWNSEGNIERKTLLYNTLKAYFAKVKFATDLLEEYRKLLTTEDFFSKWYEHLSDFVYWLNKNSNELRSVVGNGRLYLFGLGKRGKAFIRWAKENRIEIAGVSDSNIMNYDKECDIQFMERDYLLQMRHVVYIASNKNIYDELVCKTANKVINLQEFCRV